MFKEFEPGVYNVIEKILKVIDDKDKYDIFADLYSQIPSIHMDNAISERIRPELARVVVDDIGWSDVGAWEALKEALQSSDEDNVTLGRVLLQDTSDSLVYNYQDGKLVVAIDIEDGLIINTGDVLLVTKKSSVPKVKKLVESFEGTEHEELT
ncbi:MAG: Mannose-1-phosphate guanylyltransferase 1 [Microgenomates bacterium OLB23]|nr:MAG: Mannose-1-phosphate guanylyltransferase 1 [Microgenomates bacterium OLB23]